ncbi:hypothetical protein KGF56_003710 [Candida oxycetoniae]|uniref:Mitochondrial thiamine pyrophosphate carrier 1 n=1 Tax=Candida oxycetoniae TaxID=497107 RepID=A0AAI9SUR0_9ASCO|nr:uncharacterized protein KGF56_003710 [Candida oxycetoniae]KAI3403426.2 hypothetical protein KGF56_003710 [Candida oxycetoniae]
MSEKSRISNETIAQVSQPSHPTTSPDFSDIVHGEDLEIRRATMDHAFPITHKIEALGHVSPPWILSQCSASQLITLAGAASGFLAGVVVCPLDVIKTKLQAQGGSGSGSGSGGKGEGGGGGSAGRQVLGFRDTLKMILRTEGIRGLYRGLVPITIGYLPTWTIYFTVYEETKDFYPRYFSEHWGIYNPSMNHFFAAITAGSASSIAVNPIWVVKTRLMVQTSGKPISAQDVKYKGTIDAFKKMYREEGIRVFYSGLVPSLFGLLHVGIHFPVYEKLKSWLHCSTIDQQHEVPGLLWRLIAASSLSKMLASTITYPHEILRTRMQMRHNIHTNKQSTNTTFTRVSLLKIISKIYHGEGLKGFYAGYFTNLARTVPASAVTLVSFEYFKTYLLDISGKSRKLKN